MTANYVKIRLFNNTHNILYDRIIVRYFLTVPSPKIRVLGEQNVQITCQIFLMQSQSTPSLKCGSEHRRNTERQSNKLSSLQNVVCSKHMTKVTKGEQYVIFILCEQNMYNLFVCGLRVEVLSYHQTSTHNSVLVQYSTIQCTYHCTVQCTLWFADTTFYVRTFHKSSFVR